MIHKITEQQLQDYISCPVYYYFKYCSGIGIESPKTMTKLLNKVTSGFFMKMTDGKLLSAYDLKRKWDMVCSKNSDSIDSKKNINGFSLLNTMYRWAENEQLIIAGEQASFVYEVNIGNEDVASLSGTLRTIMVNKKNQLEFLWVDYGNKILDQSILDLDTKTTIDCAAFEKLYNKQILGCRVHNVKFNKDMYTTRNKMHYERLNSTLTAVVNSIKNNVVYPRQSVMCANCRTKDLCLGWS